ncbi:MAG: ANTAR domain-containing protein [Actinomycetes bacterium]
MCPAPAESTNGQTVAVDQQPIDRTIEQCRGILMGVHRVGSDTAGDLIIRVAESHGVRVRDLAVATVELVRGATPTDPTATVVAMRFLMGHPAYHRPVLDGQVHVSVREAAADMHPGPDADVERLLREADSRDRAAEQRDRAAADRDSAAHSRTHQTPADVALDEQDRDQAGIDRAWAASDRDMSADDRAALIDKLRHQPSPSPPAEQQ